MKLKKNIIFLNVFLLSILFFNCTKSIEGNGRRVIKKVVVAPGFTNIVATGTFSINLIQDTQTSITIETDENIAPFVSCKKDGKDLIINLEEEVLSYAGIVITIKMPDIDQIDLDKNVQLYANQPFITKDLKINTAGQSSINLSLQSESLTLKCTEQSKIELFGQIKEVDILAKEQAKIIATAASIFDITAEATDQASITLSPIKRIELDASDQASITYRDGLFEKEIKMTDQAEILALKDTIKEIPIDSDSIQ